MSSVKFGWFLFNWQLIPSKEELVSLTKFVSYKEETFILSLSHLARGGRKKQIGT